MIQVELNIELFMHIIFIMYGLVGTLNFLNGMFKTEKNKSMHNGVNEIVAGIIMLGICIAVVVL